MKQLQNINTNLKKSLAIGALFFFQTFAWAQDKEVDVNLNLNEGGSDWYAEPWLLVVGAAVFIIIIVALLRGKNSN